MTDIDPTAVMAAHDHAAWLPEGSPCGKCGQVAPCDAYLMAEALAASEVKVAELDYVARDYEKAWKKASEVGDRFRDVLSEALDLEKNPGDDELVRTLRGKHGKSGPEPRRWRDFLTGAVAHLEANGLRIGATLADRPQQDS